MTFHPLKLKVPALNASPNSALQYQYANAKKKFLPSFPSSR